MSAVTEFREPDYVRERRLPDGLSCADCHHGNRCDGLFGALRRGFTSCDFWPSRFSFRLQPYRPGKPEPCRECGLTNWLVGRIGAECAGCGFARPFITTP